MGDSSSQLLSLLQNYNKFLICQVFLQEIFNFALLTKTTITYFLGYN